MPSPHDSDTLASASVLIVHGDADTLVPLEQSEWFRDKARECSEPVKIVIHRGGRHGWLTVPFDVGIMADWFDAKLSR